VSQPDPELLQKAELGAGEMYDLLKERDLAIKRYQASIGAGGSSALTETARERIKEPYHGPP
jgi:hypothetical protein